MVNVLSAGEKFLAKKGVKHPRVIVYSTVAVAGVIATWLIVRAVKRAIARHKAAHPNPENIQAGLTADLSSLNTSDTTLSEGNATLIADNLLNAMNRYGTDEQAIFDNLARCQTQGDLNLVIQKFGVKPYDGFGLATGWFETNVIATMKNLNGWLRSELSGSDLDHVKAIYDSLGVSF
jgi:hypothetical protein